MRTTSCWLALGIFSVSAALALAQSQDEKKLASEERPAAEKQEQASEFPEPLQHATSNFRDLERTGFLSVGSVEFRTIDRWGNTGFVWTIRPTRTITFRHVQSILRQFHSVKFYDQQTTTQKEVHSALLHHSQRIDSGAVNGMFLSKEDQFEVWFEFSDAVRRRFARQHVDLVVFGRLKR